MFQSPQSFISYHVLTDERREAPECRHVERCCTAGEQSEEKLVVNAKFWEKDLVKAGGPVGAVVSSVPGSGPFCGVCMFSTYLRGFLRVLRSSGSLPQSEDVQD